jgi:hypothetical protein
MQPLPGICYEKMHYCPFGLHPEGPHLPSWNGGPIHNYRLRSPAQSAHPGHILSMCQYAMETHHAPKETAPQRARDRKKECVSAWGGRRGARETESNREGGGTHRERVAKQWCMLTWLVSSDGSLRDQNNKETNHRSRFMVDLEATWKGLIS